MARPYILWDPSWNADLWTRVAGGPLVVSMDDAPTPAQIETYRKLVAISERPVLYDGPNMAYAHSTDVVGGVDPEKGFRVTNLEWMPENLTFPGLGPDPFDKSNLYGGVQHRYVNLGWRFTLRGWAGTMYEGTLAGEFRIKWADELTRAASTSRAAWTGLTLGFLNTVAHRVDHVLDVLHGKREPDLDWQYHGGWLDRNPVTEVVDENTIILNGISGGNARVVISGGPPLWNVTVQYKTGTTWNDIDTFAIDFRSHLAPAPLDEIGVMASAFMGLCKELTAPPPAWPTSSVWFNELEVPQFEPWVPDRASWSERGWDEHWEWLTGSTTGYDGQLRRPVTDLVHVPIGADRGPVELRHSEPDLGICLKLGSKTNLFAVGHSDNRYIEILPGAPPQPLAVCDAQSYGPDAPFAVYKRLKLEAVDTWGVGDRAIISFGNIFNATPSAADNGIGLYWENMGGGNCRFVAKFYTTAWEDVRTEEIPIAEITDRPIDIGFAWTGSRGVSIGRQNYEMRIVIDGVTKAAGIHSDFHVAGTETAQIGAVDAVAGFQGLLGAAAVFGDPVTDYDLRGAFAGAQAPFSNPSFEEAATIPRPGEAKDWSWFSIQNAVDWAEFNAQVPEYEQWRTAMEEFGPGWNNLESWVNYTTDLELVAMLFNAGVTLYESTTEEFWLWTVWNGAGWVTGTPWREDWTFIQPFEEKPAPTGFRGWYDLVHSTHHVGFEQEEFGEAWNNDPFSTSSGYLWYPGSGENGSIKGAQLEFPVTIPPDKRSLVVLTYDLDLQPLELVVGVYDDAVALAAMIQARWDSHVGPVGIEFSAWQDGEASGVAFGWDGVTVCHHGVMFGMVAAQEANDARPLLGLRSFGPGGRWMTLYEKASWAGPASAADPGDVFLMDTWSFMLFQIKSDPYCGQYPLHDRVEEAVFDTAISDSTILERFTLQGWFGLGAQWKTGYSPGDLTAALFDSGTTAMEEFDPAKWPDEVWT